MGLRYLFGPVTPSFADEHLNGLRRSGECITFDHSGKADLAIGAVDTWDDVCHKLPDGWHPDCIALTLAYTTIPPALWKAPVPILGLAADGNLLWHYYRHVLPRCDLILTDVTSQEKMQAAGHHHARVAHLYGLGRSYLDVRDEEYPRDIDVLFVGNLHAAVQRERLAWLGRLAALGGRWRVVIRTGVFGDEYRALLRQSRIVFNRSVRGECNMRALEATAAGALLFQEADNREVPSLFAPSQEYVQYTDDDLERLLEHYLTQETERRRLAQAGQQRSRKYGYEALWQNTLAEITTSWPEVQERCRQRLDQQRLKLESASDTESEVQGYGHANSDDLLTRTWQALGAGLEGDAALVGDLEAALLDHPLSADIHNALGMAVALAGRRDGPLPAATAHAAARHFYQATRCAPGHLLASLNLVETIVGTDQTAVAVQGAHRALALLERNSNELEGLTAPHFPPEFDLFRVEWERAAWDHAGRPEAESEAKRALLCWRLHTLLAELTGRMTHYAEAVRLRPDLPGTQAAYGCALGRAGRPDEAVPSLSRAVAANPFDSAAARALFQALGDTGELAAQQSLAAGCRLLRQAAPQSVPNQPWFSDSVAPSRIPDPPLEPSGPMEPSLVVPTLPGIPEEQLDAGATRSAIIWEGDQLAVHSLAVINRQLCHKLLEHGHELSLLPGRADTPRSDPTAEDRPLTACFNRPLSRAADVHVCHQWPPQLKPPPEGHWVLMQPWEYGSLPRAWIDPLVQAIDEVWVPSRFVRDTFVRSGVPLELVRVIPLGVDHTLIHPQAPKLPLHSRKRVKFLFVGGTIFRKGIDILLEVYTQTFADADDVCLIIKDMGVGTFYCGQTAEAQIAQLRNTPGMPKIEYINRELSNKELAGLYTACDCLVHPYRGEGFGLPILEAMAAGLPVIVTGMGAALDFCTDGTAYLLPARPAQYPEKRVGNLETVDYPWLAEPDRAALSAALKHVVAHAEEARTKGAAGRAAVLALHTWDKTAEAVEQRLRQLRNRPIRRMALHGVPKRTSTPVIALPPGKARVTLCMIVKNEEANLAECLASTAGLFAEIIVVDTGSGDRTREIAADCGAQVFEFPWCDSFAAARNESLRHAAGEWIFWLDADDRLDAANRDKLHKLFDGLSDINAAYVLKCLCLPSGESHTPTAVDHVRLFRNHPAIRWEHRVHEQILPAVRGLQGEVRFTDIVIHHTGYMDKALRSRKLERDLRLLRLEYEERPNHPFTLFNLGQTYHELGQFDVALTFLRRSLESSQPQDSIVRKLYALIALCHKLQGQLHEALAACQEGRRYYADDAELLSLEGSIRQELGDSDGALACLVHLRTAEPAPHFASVDPGLRTYRALHQAALILEKQGQLAEAEANWRQAVDEGPNFLPAWLHLAELYLGRERWPELENLLSRMQSYFELETAVLRARGQMARREFQVAQHILHDLIAQQPYAVWPRVILSHALLQESTDLEAAEEALRDVLALEPGHAEARNNLRILLRSQNRASDEFIVQGTSLAALYHVACEATSSLSAALPRVFELASLCRHATALGTRQGDLATALLFAQPDALVCYDRERPPQLERLRALACRTVFHFRLGDAPSTLDATDLLVIDSCQVGGRWDEALRRLGSKVGKYIILAASVGKGRSGLWSGLQEFLAQGTFQPLDPLSDDNILAVLEVTRPVTALHA
jgi:glycosyltransferase involved in cell wall biosynthesis/tetratricopeptide (TPR) repeat protein